MHRACRILKMSYGALFSAFDTMIQRARTITSTYLQAEVLGSGPPAFFFSCHLVVGC